MGLFDKLKNEKMTEGRVEQETGSKGGFVGFTLLSEASWDKEQLKKDLQSDWSLDTAEDSDSTDENLVFHVGEMIAVVGLMPAPVPNGEAEQNALSNYMWPEAAETAKAHRAHLMVSVLGSTTDLRERGKLFVKLMTCCCKQKNALGIYTSGTVFEPRFYMAAAEMMREGNLPILNWIWFGLYRSEGGVTCYTYGMEQFGKDEMEVLDANAQPSDVRDFLLDLVSYVLECDVTLSDGETIGFSEEDRHSIILSEGVMLPGKTLKISYKSSAGR